MNRLTEKLNKPLIINGIKIIKYRPKKSCDSCINKLGKLEDIEELCIKISKQPIYIKSGNYIEKLDFREYYIFYYFEDDSIHIYAADGLVYSLGVKSYGENWALTEKELENEKH